MKPLSSDREDDTHVYPVLDVIPHTYTRNCWCGPRVEDIEDSDAKIVVHNSADGREDFEGLVESCRQVRH